MAANKGKSSSRADKLYSTEEVSKVLKLKKRDLKAFETEGFFEFADRAKKKIDHTNFVRLKMAAGLKRDLGVNHAGIDVILHMREKMARMQREFNLFLVHMKHQLGNRLDRNFKEIKKRI